MDAGKIEAFLTRLGCDKIKMRGYQWVRSSCPFARWRHTSAKDEHPSFAVSISPGDSLSFYNCQACRVHGDLFSLLWRLEKYRHVDASLFAFVQENNQPNPHREPRVSEDDLSGRLKRLESYEEIDPGTKLRFIEEEKQAVVPESVLDGYRAHMPEAITQYLYDRGLTDETIDAFEIGWHAEQKRLVIPIRDEAKTLVALSGRAISDEVKPKYLHSRFKRDRVLYNEDKIQKDRPCFLVEGFFQAIFLHQCGYENALARMGTHLSKSQFEKLVTYFSEVVIVPDGDAAGRSSAAEIEALLKTRTKVTIVDMPDGMDADRLSVWHIEKLLGKPTRAASSGS